MQRILLASDHAGFTLKASLQAYLNSLSYQTLDLGTHQKQSCHYPNFAQAMANTIQPQDLGILVCGSGIGIGIAANKCGLECATAYNQYTAAECGRHFRVMALGERSVPLEVAKEMVKEFIKANEQRKK